MCIVYEEVRGTRKVRSTELCEYAQSQGNRPCAQLTAHKLVRVDEAYRLLSCLTPPSKAVVIHQPRQPRPKVQSFDAIDVELHWKGPEFKLVKTRKEKMKARYPDLPAAIPPPVPCAPPAGIYVRSRTSNGMVVTSGCTALCSQPGEIRSDSNHAISFGRPSVYRTAVVRPDHGQLTTLTQSDSMIVNPSYSAFRPGVTTRTKHRSPSPSVPPPPPLKSALKKSRHADVHTTPQKSARISSENSSSSSSTLSSRSTGSGSGLSSSSSATEDTTSDYENDKHSDNFSTGRSSTDSGTSRDGSDTDRTGSLSSSSSSSQSGRRRRRRREHGDVDETALTTEYRLQSALARMRLDEVEARLRALRR